MILKQIRDQLPSTLNLKVNPARKPFLNFLFHLQGVNSFQTHVNSRSMAENPASFLQNHRNTEPIIQPRDSVSREFRINIENLRHAIDLNQKNEGSVDLNENEESGSSREEHRFSNTGNFDFTITPVYPNFRC